MTMTLVFLHERAPMIIPYYLCVHRSNREKGSAFNIFLGTRKNVSFHALPLNTYYNSTSGMVCNWVMKGNVKKSKRVFKVQTNRSYKRTVKHPIRKMATTSVVRSVHISF